MTPSASASAQPGNDTDLRIGVMGSPDFTAGFALAGVRDTFNTTAHEARETLRSATLRTDLGILIVEEETLAALSTSEKERLLCILRPVIIFISARPEGKTVTLAASIKRALGIDVSARGSTTSASRAREEQDAFATNPSGGSL